MTHQDKFACQMALPHFGAVAQRLLANSKVLVIGAGGLGCPALMYLASSGIGHLGIADFDVIATTNLHRQILYSHKDVGKYKAEIATQKLQAQFQDIVISTHAHGINPDNALNIVGQYNLILDCTDNFEARYLVNDACVMLGKPLIYGAIYQYEGQVAIWNTLNADGSYSPNYRDIYPEVDATKIPNCAEGGVFPALAGIIGCMQASIAIKHIIQAADNNRHQLISFNALTLQTHMVVLPHSSEHIIKQLTVQKIGNEISYDDYLKDAQNYQLVDVRTLAERGKKNIGGLHIPLDKIGSANLGNILPSSIVFYCASGIRSREALKVALHLWPEKTFYQLKGGIDQL